jgi:quercetin dioxygenase-like cupin family protein
MDRYRLEDFIGGWIIGDFVPSVLRTPQFEAGLKIHRRGEVIQKHFHKAATEYNIVVCGQMRVNGALLAEDDVFVLKRGECVHAEVLSEEARVMVIKVPSIPGDKYPCEHS